MKNVLSDFRHNLLLILLLATSPSLKTEVEAKAAEIKFGRGVFNTRGLLSKSQDPSPTASQEPSPTASSKPPLESSPVATSEPLPEPSLEHTTPEPVSGEAPNKGTQNKDKDNDDDGLSKSAHIGTAIAFGFLLFLLFLTLIYYFWLKQPPGIEYTAVPAAPLVIGETG